MHPLVSILIPAYNSEKWIKSTIQSALNQTYSNKEIIIVDDGSTDQTFRIAKQFESDNLKVVSQENQGASTARNRALSISQGDFIQWLDSEDLISSDKIEKQLATYNYCPPEKTLLSSPAGFFYHRPSRAKFICNALWQDLNSFDWLITKFSDTKAHIYIHAWLVSRKLTELAGPWNESLSLNDDGEYFCRIVAESNFVKFINDVKCYYRIGNFSSISNRKSENALKSEVLSINLCVDHLLKLEKSEVVRKASISYLQNLVSGISTDMSYLVEDTKKRIIEMGGSIYPPSESRKFIFIKKTLGLRIANFIKKWLWDIERLVQKEFEKILAFLFRDGV
jgi:glycosyltransferase involved in cell wall biosynthesis